MVTTRARAALSGTGEYVPPHVVTNVELSQAFNQWASTANSGEFSSTEFVAGAEEGELALSDPRFIEKSSGIRARHVVDATGILDPERLCPRIAPRPDTQISLQAEMAKSAAEQALARAGRKASEVDLVIVGASSLQRPFPSIAIELQEAIGANGHAFDISVGVTAQPPTTDGERRSGVSWGREANNGQREG